MNPHQQFPDREVKFAVSTNSSAVRWTSTSAAPESLSTIIRNQRFVVVQPIAQEKGDLKKEES
jgi:hypothetical protein